MPEKYKKIQDNVKKLFSAIVHAAHPLFLNLRCSNVRLDFFSTSSNQSNPSPPAKVTTLTSLQL